VLVNGTAYSENLSIIDSSEKEPACDQSGILGNFRARHNVNLTN